MSVAKESAMERLIQHIKDAMAIGKIADMDTTLNINSRNPVENKVITQAINGINNRLDEDFVKNGDIIEFTNTASVNSNAKHTFTFHYNLTTNGYKDAIVLDYLQTDEPTGTSNYVDSYVGGCFVDHSLSYPYVKKRTYTQLVTENKSIDLYLNIYNESASAQEMRGTVRVLLIK